MKTKKKLIDVFPNWLTSGIFTALNNYNVPWKKDVDGAVLDAEYFGNFSGSKNLSPLVKRLLNVDEDTTLSNTRINQLASIIYNLNGVNWTKEYATLGFEYNPISNYDMTETETASGTTSNEKHNTGTVGDVRTESGTSSASGNAENDVYGFNSSTAVNDTASETTSSATAQNTVNDTRTDNLTETDSGERSDERTLTRSGNIGVTTSQQMIQSERELYLWNFFYKVVFPSVDKTLTIATYGDSYITPVLSSGGSSGGGRNAQIMEKLNEIGAKIDTNTASINSKIDTNTASINSKIDTNTASINGAITNTNTKIDANTTSINLSINELRTSTFEAIDGVTTRQY